MEYWFAEQEARLRNLPATKRYLYAEIDWSAYGRLSISGIICIMDIIHFFWKEKMFIP